MILSRMLTIAAFTLAGVLAVGVELAARREGSRIPTLADVCTAVMRYRLGRWPVGGFALLVLWWWVGWHLFAR